MAKYWTPFWSLQSASPECWVWYLLFRFAGLVRFDLVLFGLLIWGGVHTQHCWRMGLLDAKYVFYWAFWARTHAVAFSEGNFLSHKSLLEEALLSSHLPWGWRSHRGLSAPVLLRVLCFFWGSICFWACKILKVLAEGSHYIFWCWHSLHQ